MMIFNSSDPEWRRSNLYMAKMRLMACVVDDWSRGSWAIEKRRTDGATFVQWAARWLFS